MATISPEQPGQRVPVRPPSQSGTGWILGLVLGAFAIVILGLFGLVGAIAIFGDSAAEATPSTTLDVTLREFVIGGDLTAPAGEVTLAVSNTGSTDHNIVLPGLGIESPMIGAGGTALVSLGELAPGTYEVLCDVPGHDTSGMVGVLTITSADDFTAAADTGDDHGGHGAGADFAAMDQAMMDSILAFPAETEGKGNPLLAPTEILADGTKVFDLTAEIVDWEVEPGRIVEAWTYNGVVPAPQIILDRGDKVKVRLVNDLPMGTDIHWHGVRTPNDQDGVAPITQDLVEPNGGTFEYEFVANEDAIGMYHAHNHAQVQVVNGMFGVIRIGDNPMPRGSTISGVTIPDDVEFAVDIPMILNDAGTIGYSLNGKSFPATEPLVLTQGDWVSVTYYNEGLQIHPMHLHQFPQLVYAKDGIPLDVPYWTDTLNVAPGERYTVAFRADDVGTWVWHCHILTHVEREEGMFGMVTAIVVNENLDFDPEDEPIEPTNWRLNGANARADAAADTTEADAEEQAAADNDS